MSEAELASFLAAHFNLIAIAVALASWSAAMLTTLVVAKAL